MLLLVFVCSPIIYLKAIDETDQVSYFNRFYTTLCTIGFLFSLCITSRPFIRSVISSAKNYIINVICLNCMYYLKVIYGTDKVGHLIVHVITVVWFIHLILQACSWKRLGE